MINLTKDNISYYLSEEKPLFVDFYAEWCNPCMQIMKIIHRIEEPLSPRVNFGKINIETEKELATLHQIRSVPTFALFIGGMEVLKWSGVKSIQEMQKLIEDALNKQ